MRDQVFISYSHEDETLMKEFLTHMKPPSAPGSRSGPASGERFEEIQTALARARVAVLLVSPDFLASDFIYKQELGPLLAEAKAGGVRILWVSLRPCSYEETGLKDLQAVASPCGSRSSREAPG